MKKIGAHVSSAGGVDKAPLNASRIGATAFALFTKNQRQWRAKPLEEETIRNFRKNCREAGFGPQDILPHDSYLINLGHPDPVARNKSIAAFVEELERCRQLGLEYLTLHPGSHLRKISEEECLILIADGINQALAQTSGVVAVLENTAGQGSNVGYRFEHLAAIIERVEDKKRIGVCFDTCHAFAAGYDLTSNEACHHTFREFDSIVGFCRLKGMHLNDSKKGRGSRVDRHENLGQGLLGLAPFAYLMNDSGCNDIPLVLETPHPEQWAAEIKLLRSLKD